MSGFLPLLTALRLNMNTIAPPSAKTRPINAVMTYTRILSFGCPFMIAVSIKHLSPSAFLLSLAYADAGQSYDCSIIGGQCNFAQPECADYIASVPLYLMRKPCYM